MPCAHSKGFNRRTFHFGTNIPRGFGGVKPPISFGKTLNMLNLFLTIACYVCHIRFHPNLKGHCLHHVTHFDPQPRRFTPVGQIYRQRQLAPTPHAGA